MHTETVEEFLNRGGSIQVVTCDKNTTDASIKNSAKFHRENAFCEELTFQDKTGRKDRKEHGFGDKAAIQRGSHWYGIARYW